LVVPMPQPVALEPFDVSRMLVLPEPQQSVAAELGSEHELEGDASMQGYSVFSGMSKLPRYLQTSLDDAWSFDRL
jgi:hypothetical protein